MKRIKQLWLVLAIFMLPMTAAYAIDRLLLAPACPDCWRGSNVRQGR